MLAEGVRKVEWTCPICRKKYPSRAIAYGTLDPERIEPFNAAKMEIMAATLTAPAPFGPAMRRIMSAATRSLEATSPAFNTEKYARLVRRYTPIIAMTPAIRARGNVLCGFSTSEPSMPALFHPSYAQRAATNATKNPAAPPGIGSVELWRFVQW